MKSATIPRKTGSLGEQALELAQKQSCCATESANSGSGPPASVVSWSVALRRSGPSAAMLVPLEGAAQLTSAKAKPAICGDAGRAFGCEPLKGFDTKSLRS